MGHSCSRWRCFCLLILGSWFVIFILTDEPFGLSLPIECKRLDTELFLDLEGEMDGVNDRAEVLRDYALKCFPTDWTVMLYKDGTSSSEMDFKQGFGFFEFLSEIVNQDQATQASIKAKLDVLQFQHKCAIIGNSGILVNSSCGNEIDNNYDYVIRSNIAPIRNFERDVGTKTNLTVLNYSITNTLYLVFSSSGQTKEKAIFMERLRWLNDSVLWYHKGARTRFWAKRKLRYLANELKISYNLPIRIAYTYTPMEHLTKWFWSIDVPYTTTGLNMFTAAAAFCADITLYGFYPFKIDNRGRQIRHHYFENLQFDYNYNRIHNFQKEFSLLQTLDKMNVLHLKTTPCIEYI
ncbi:CMP-N-acetylneuraminate-poly-alpha-2,8-sialyltransferase-like [Anneissia japonica]|uniref:CMP-N-acetylneuraminate-poly-alpha-2, 8-sialyltransferase-like n=1 Tax=Anneissia japonica TaxID=1529436 RepID=UPI001425A037|nr:CMP-N-acetylneuraminate-poly-alpha-2,8-sialyltransferase-like [Anneissia japonica]